MPNRILREGILTSPRMARLDWAAEVFYRRLMSVVDDFGRYYADAGMLRAACYPRQLSKVSDSDVGKWLQGIEAAGLVRVYPAKDGERYLELLDFGQQVRAKKSKFPDQISTCVADAKQMQSGGVADAPVFVSVVESEDVSAAPDGADGFEAVWIAYPKRPGNSKADALKAWKARVKEGHKPGVMAEGLRRYAAYCAAQQTEPRFIKLAATFFGPGLHFQDEWKADATNGVASTETVEQYQARVAAERAAERDRATRPPADLLLRARGAIKTAGAA